MKKAIIPVILAAIILTMLIPFSTPSHAQGEPDTANADCVYLYNINTDTVLYKKNISLKVKPASAVKMMTALLALEHYDDFTETVSVTAELLAGSDGTGYGFKAGASQTLHDIFATLVLWNANDAAVILANSISGTTEKFVAKMNERAAKLGMNDTHYTNPTGLDSDEMYTTAEDTAKLAMALYNLPRFITFSDAPSVVLDRLKDEKNPRIYNKNYMIGTWYSKAYYDSDATGMNAGYTGGAGNVITVSATKKGNDFICVVLGGKTADDKNQAYVIAGNMLSWGSTAFKYINVLNSAEVYCELPVSGGNKSDYAAVFPARTIDKYLPADTDPDNDITYKWELYFNSLKAPVEDNTEIGEIRVYCKGEEIASSTLVIRTSIAKGRSAYFVNLLKTILTSPLFYCLVIAAVLIFTVSFVRKKRAKKRYSDGIEL